MSTSKITKAEFDTLAAAHHIIEERDIEYSYETIVDDNKTELAFASYRNCHPTEYYRVTG